MQYGTIITPTIYQKICKQEHYMIKHQGFGISTKELETIEQNNIRIIRIIYIGKTENKIYISTIKQWIDSNKKENYENDEQKFLPINEMIEEI